MADYNIDVHDHGTEALSVGLLILLIIFFPIGIMVLIVRTASRLKNEKTNRDHIREETKRLKTDISLSQASELERYKALFDKGILTKIEYEAKKQSILKGTNLQKEISRQNNNIITKNTNK